MPAKLYIHTLQRNNRRSNKRKQKQPPENKRTKNQRSPQGSKESIQTTRLSRDNDARY